jgi:hypothetical protein
MPWGKPSEKGNRNKDRPGRMRIAFEVRSICISFHRSRQSTVRAFALTGDDQIPDTADKPVGVNRRSSLHLTHLLAKDFDGVIHWARDTETFQSILKSFIQLDLQSVSPPELPEDWKPDITILAANE